MALRWWGEGGHSYNLWAHLAPARLHLDSYASLLVCLSVCLLLDQNSDEIIIHISWSLVASHSKSKVTGWSSRSQGSRSRVFDKGSWAHINVKLLQFSFSGLLISAHRRTCHPWNIISVAWSVFPDLMMFSFIYTFPQRRLRFYFALFFWMCLQRRRCIIFMDWLSETSSGLWSIIMYSLRALYLLEGGEHGLLLALIYLSLFLKLVCC